VDHWGKPVRKAGENPVNQPVIEIGKTTQEIYPPVVPLFSNKSCGLIIDEVHKLEVLSTDSPVPTGTTV
jgi:hypothetical protein